MCILTYLWNAKFTCHCYIQLAIYTCKLTLPLLQACRELPGKTILHVVLLFSLWLKFDLTLNLKFFSHYTLAWRSIANDEGRGLDLCEFYPLCTCRVSVHYAKSWDNLFKFRPWGILSIHPYNNICTHYVFCRIHIISVVQVNTPMLPSKFANLKHPEHSDYFIDLVPVLRLFLSGFFLGCLSFLGDLVVGGKALAILSSKLMDAHLGASIDSVSWRCLQVPLADTGHELVGSSHLRQLPHR